jgi:2-polyprenyl-3-methyl-5-hydroxy-6-metoxy-1,4-benzoquinol methylase
MEKGAVLMNADEFSMKMTEILNYGALNLAMGIGYKAGLFDVMADLGRPESIEKIADKAGLNARYVEEWMGVMACGGIVEIDQDRYYLPEDHARFLTTDSGDSNMGVYTQEIPLLTKCALEQVEKGFVTGQGVDFSFYPEFQSFMAQLSDAKHEKVLVEKFLPCVDGGELVELLKKGIRVCDLGCGQGVALILMAQHFPDSVFTGIDNHEKAIETARRKAQGLDNINFMVQDAALVENDDRFREKFDYITAFDAIHDQTRPMAALKGIVWMLAPGGMFSMVDIDAQSSISGNLEHPMGPFLYGVSLMHCMPVGFVNGGKGLGMMWGRQKAVRMLEQAGFGKISVQEMDHDPFNVHYFCRR